jgi:phosphatidylserine/phosphatidylglycerophosphate/cardiolipin synthase-like enzyme
VSDLEVLFLEAGKQTAVDVATRLAGFVAQATQTIDIAIYDMYLTGAAADILIGALLKQQQAGVRVRLCYDLGDDTDKALDQGDPPPTTKTATFVATSGLPCKAIASQTNLMHQKYIVLDAYTPQAQVLAGSSNFTDDSWTVQENNILFLASPQLANHYAQDFQELWATASIQTTGAMDSGDVTLNYGGAPAPTTVAFAPGQGEWIDAQIARCIGKARREVTFAFAVLTSGHILGAIGDLMHLGIPIDGLYDRTQMEGVFYQWQQITHNQWKIGAFNALVQYGHLVGKNTTPWTPTSVHDFMHNKIIVVDDTLITGSYNFSRNAQENAENLLLIESPALTADYRAYIRHLAARYGQTG